MCGGTDVEDIDFSTVTDFDLIYEDQDNGQSSTIVAGSIVDLAYADEVVEVEEEEVEEVEDGEGDDAEVEESSMIVQASAVALASVAMLM